MTQQQLASSLSQISVEFQSLNTVTLSRWETGTTAPSLKKKRLILHYLQKNHAFEAEVCAELMRTRYEALYTPLSQVFSQNYQYLIGNLPEHRGAMAPRFHTLHDYADKKTHIEHLVDIEIATNVTHYYIPSYAQMGRWCDLPTTFAVIAERKRQHLGHMVMFKIKNRVAEEIAHHRRSEFDLRENDFCGVEERGTYYVHALYGRSPKIAAMLNVKAYLHLFNHLKSIDNVMIFSSRADGVSLTRNYGIKTVAHGYNDRYGFKWYGMMSPVEDILFSDLVIKMAF